MKLRRFFSASVITGLAAVMPLRAAEVPAPTDFPVAQGPFTAAPESLRQYKVPDWFRDAKFGIWLHWGPQAVPRQGDWYARKMYEEGSPDYQHHLKTYGHPSKTGYKDIIPLWRAEKWNPDELMALYARAGAKYFVSMGVHHDNFDLWNSKFHRWNAVQMGPHRDIVGDWKKAALKQGLRFGVSEHLAASYLWFQGSHGADKTGPFAGVPYDGADPRYQDLYHPPSLPGDRGWYSNNPAWHREWYRRIQDLVDNYQPDLLYSDGSIPFYVGTRGDTTPGRSLIAHFYNLNIQKNGGRLEAVYNYKNAFQGTGVQDLERAALQGINPLPWQTDTSNGDWYYRENGRYKTTSRIIHSLIDIVSKNGNMLLNVVQLPDGSLPPESQQFLKEMAAWMPLNGEAIYGTRPWTIYGEGPTQLKVGKYNENADYTAQDIRFTTKNGILYAMTLGIPTREIVIKSLATNTALVSGQPTQIMLLGYAGKLEWTQTAQGLKIQLPDHLPCKHALSFKISGFKTVAALASQKLTPIKATAPLTDVPATQTQTIRPGELWLDDRGRHIQAHGGGILKLGETWYWFGADSSQDNDPDKRYVACYSSTDLVNWKFRNQVVQMNDPENFGPGWVLERPKVFYNAKTKKFVMYMHVDGSTPKRPSYGLGRVAVAVSDTVDGNYKYIRGFQPLGQESRDIGQFIDDDGSAYLIFESRPTKGFYIAKLSDDYLDVEREVCLVKAPLEGGALVNFGGMYYMIGSGLTGWRPNANKYATARRLEGPWSEFKDIALPELKTYGSQSSMLIKVVGTKKTSVIFLGDIWQPHAQWKSTYLWMPLEIGDGKIRLPAPKPWKLDAKTGETVIAP